MCVCVLQLQLLGEVRGVMRPADLDRYNELTVHREIAAKKVWFSLITTSIANMYVVYNIHRFQ